MEKLDKPNFFSAQIFFNFVSSVFGICGFIQLFLPIWTLKIKIITLGISLIISIFSMVFKYVSKINKFYSKYLLSFEEFKDISEKHNALSKEYIKKSKEFQSMEDLLKIYENSIIDIENIIMFGIIQASDSEINYLQKVHSLISNKRAFLLNIEGGLENGRKNIQSNKNNR